MFRILAGLGTIFLRNSFGMSGVVGFDLLVRLGVCLTGCQVSRFQRANLLSRGTGIMRYES